MLALATGAGAQTGAQRRPAPGPTPDLQRQAQAGGQASPSAHASPDEPGRAATPASPAHPRSWWPVALAGLAAALGLAALLARRSRQAPAPAPTYSEGWQGIGGPSYAPRPTTVRVEPRTVRLDTARINGRHEAARQPETLRRPFGVPPDFDAPGFLDSARQSFVRLQSAWDRSDLNELNECTTDEMFNALTHELRVRAGPSRTEVMELTASLLGIETAAGEFRASVRFSGNLKINGEDERLDEVWNLSKPEDGSSGWLLAGIQQLN
jgi:predicted lipid-binding transport protein (Tim44 family)